MQNNAAAAGLTDAEIREVAQHVPGANHHRTLGYDSRTRKVLDVVARIKAVAVATAYPKSPGARDAGFDYDVTDGGVVLTIGGHEVDLTIESTAPRAVAENLDRLTTVAAEMVTQVSSLYTALDQARIDAAAEIGCEACGGWGHDPGDPMRPCPACSGSGRARAEDHSVPPDPAPVPEPEPVNWSQRWWHAPAYGVLQKPEEGGRRGRADDHVEGPYGRDTAVGRSNSLRTTLGRTSTVVARLDGVWRTQCGQTPREVIDHYEDTGRWRP